MTNQVLTIKFFNR